MDKECDNDACEKDAAFIWLGLSMEEACNLLKFIEDWGIAVDDPSIKIVKKDLIESIKEKSRENQ